MRQSGLTPKQQRFVAEYLVDCCGAAAAIRAGYAPRWADRQASALLREPQIAAAIAAKRGRLEVKTEVTQVQVLRELALLAFSDIGDVVDFAGETPRIRTLADIPEGARRAIQSVKVRRHVEGHGKDAHDVEVIEVKLWSKEQALDKLARHLGMFLDPVVPGDFAGTALARYLADRTGNSHANGHANGVGNGHDKESIH